MITTSFGGKLIRILRYSLYLKFNFPVKMFRVLVIFLFISQVYCNFNCTPCVCVNNGHSYEANCIIAKTHFNITNVPTNLDPSIDTIRLNAQPLKFLPRNVFSYLSNIKTITLDHCELEEIHKEAFNNLTRLKDLEVMNNKLTDISVGTFQDTYNLERLFLNDNKLKRLRKGLLSNLTELKTVYFVHNEIEYIEEDFFEDNINLKDIALSNNKLKYMNGNMIAHLSNLNTLTVFENPWQCYCNLTSLFELASKHLTNSHLAITTCEEPKTLQNKRWDNLIPTNFTCEPKITILPNNILYTNQKVTNITLTCQIQANPTPVVKWVKNNYLSSNIQALDDFTVLHEITINNTEDIDTYTCQANNTLGTDEKNITIINIPERHSIILEETIDYINFTCKLPFFNKEKVLWLYNNSTINSVTFKNKYLIYNITSNTIKNVSNSLLLVKNVTKSDEGLYSCTNVQQKTEQYFQLTISEASNLSLILIITFSVLLVVVLLVLPIGFWYFKFKKGSKMKRNSSHESISLKFLAGIENEDEFMEESPCYLTTT